VLFQNRLDMFTNMGGDSIQVLKTKEFLQYLGIHIDLSLQPAPDLSSYDLVHLFNITKVDETFVQMLHAKRNNKKVILSPIYWNMKEYRRMNTTLASTGRHILSGISKTFSIFEKHRTKSIRQLPYSEFLTLQRTVLDQADAILPNSAMERDLLTNDFRGIDAKKIFVIPNGVETSMLNKKKSSFADKLNLKNYILCVGRIEERKNQYRLIRSLSKTTIPLILIGKMPNSYYALFCQKEARKRKNVYFLGEVPHEELGPIYADAIVHALPSWYETPGLANLEAGLLGCNLAISNRGSVGEYFGDLAYYCEPSNERSIRDAVIRAYNTPKSDVLSRFIQQNYSWEVVAKKTLSCYLEILNNAKPQIT